jgi:type II secretory pathway pseudopilin PulG
MKRQTGYTLLESLSVIIVLTIVVAALAPQWNASLRKVQIKRLMDESLLVANAARIHSRRVQSTTVNPDGSITYTYYANGATYLTAADLNTAMGMTLPTINPWGESYQVMANGTTAFARSKVPLPASLLSGSFIRGEVIDADNSYVYVDSQMPMSARAMELRPLTIKALGYQENTR